MAIRHRDIPLDLVPDALRPFIAQLNYELRELTALEGTLSESQSSKRSDSTIARRQRDQVHITRITPDITETVSSTDGSISRRLWLGNPPEKVVLRVKAGVGASPDEFYISMKQSDGTWQWNPVTFAT